MSDHIFVLSDQNSDLAGHMSFQKKKTISSLSTGETNNRRQFSFLLIFEAFPLSIL